MLDPAVGSAGVAVLVMYFSGMIIVFNIGFGSSLAIFTSVITAEVIAKYVMVLLAYKGLSAWEGSSSPFTVVMKDKRKILAATGIMVTIVGFARQLCWLCCTDYFNCPRRAHEDMFLARALAGYLVTFLVHQMR